MAASEPAEPLLTEGEDTLPVLIPSSFYNIFPDELVYHRIVVDINEGRWVRYLSPSVTKVPLFSAAIRSCLGPL